jgi:hypothetical protein
MAWTAGFGTQVLHRCKTKRNAFHTKVGVSEIKVVAVNGEGSGSTQGTLIEICKIFSNVRSK